MRGGHPSEDEQLVRPLATVSLDQDARARRARDPGLYPLLDQPQDLLQVVRPLPGGGNGLPRAHGPLPPPHRHPRSVSQRLAERVVALRRTTSYGPQAPGLLPGSRMASPISVFGVYRVLQRAGLARKRHSRPRKKPQSYATAVPRRVQIDVKYLPLLSLKGCPEPLRQYLYNAIDGCTRLQVAYVSSELTPPGQRPLPPASPQLLPLSHPGSPHRSRYGVHLCLLPPCADAPPLSSRPSLTSASATSSSPWGPPQQNDKVERSHRTLDEECLNSRAFRKPWPRAFAIKRWVTFYNSQRPHSALH